MATQAQRLAAVQARAAVENCVARYLDLCDVPTDGDPSELGELFTQDAVWEGIGPEYEGKFGRVEGREQVVELVRSYLPPSDHFRRNAHLLSAGQIHVDVPTATGRWLMQQLSLYADGTADLLCARLTLDFEIHDDPDASTARISHFRTQRLFAAPLDAQLMAHVGSLNTEEDIDE